MIDVFYCQKIDQNGLIADIAIMNAGGVTVPLFTTYSEKDYEYIINDCKPKICIISNEIQFKKIEKFNSTRNKSYFN